MKKAINLFLKLVCAWSLFAVTACGMAPSLETLNFSTGNGIQEPLGNTKQIKCPCEADFAKQWNASTFGCKAVLDCERHGGDAVFHFEGFTDYGAATGKILCHTKGGGIVSPDDIESLDEREAQRGIDGDDTEEEEEEDSSDVADDDEEGSDR